MQEWAGMRVGGRFHPSQAGPGSASTITPSGPHIIKPQIMLQRGESQDGEAEGEEKGVA